MRIHLVLALSVLASGLAGAVPLWNEPAVVKAVGKKVISKEKEKDGDCMVSRYFFRKSPDVALEFRCNRVNIAWDQFKEKEFEQKNKEAVALATRAAAALSKDSGKEVSEAAAGNVIRKRPLSSGLTVGGSCSLPSCLLTYR